MLSAFLFFITLPAVASAQAETARVRHVLDGDSFLLADGRQVRLIGINAPELGKDGAPSQPLAQQARNRLSRLIKGQTLTLSHGRERQDHYGRWLVHARLADGASIEEILLREGLAWAIAIPPNVDQLDSLLRAETEARAAGRGVWGEAAYTPKPASDLTEKDTGFRFIQGTIQRRAKGRKVIYFDLAPHVALVVPHAEWKKYFDVQGGTNVAGDRMSGANEGKSADLVGRSVVARGWLTQSKGRLHLRVPHPAMLTWRD
ncbi:nuclease [Sulfuricaulis limicola]|uniref:Nuclease n=1 Tax=Sulfuricaulis limicola TaxID=1620215 RepID=A0A1B4XJQ5_9GAMM|nr:thermonuclease family protein [Sulfuricaulis limicola]BAV35026.1 nuclease [Sulfuricaulis limicola]